jgi:hypothetical protein
MVALLGQGAHAVAVMTVHNGSLTSARRQGSSPTISYFDGFGPDNQGGYMLQTYTNDPSRVFACVGTDECAAAGITSTEACANAIATGDAPGSRWSSSDGNSGSSCHDPSFPGPDAATANTIAFAIWFYPAGTVYQCFCAPLGYTVSNTLGGASTFFISNYYGCTTANPCFLGKVGVAPSPTPAPPTPVLTPSPTPAPTPAATGHDPAATYTTNNCVSVPALGTYDDVTLVFTVTMTSAPGMAQVYSTNSWTPGDLHIGIDAPDANGATIFFRGQR